MHPSIPELTQDLHEMEAERTRDRMLFWLHTAEGLLWVFGMCLCGGGFVAGGCWAERAVRTTKYCLTKSLLTHLEN